MSLVRRPAPVVPPSELHVVIGPMRRRHVRSVMKIEQQVYPKPWTPGVFHQEIANRDGSRCYVVARSGSTLLGYGGFLTAGEDAHITNVAVDPTWQRHGIGTRVLLTLAREARVRGLQHLTLEVRVSNGAAQELYRRFGFVPAGVRRRYYENVEDAIVMWANDIGEAAYAERLRDLEAGLPGATTWEGLG